MTKENEEKFMKWLSAKHKDSDVASLPLEEQSWWDAEEQEFKQYHPSAGTFVRNLTTDEFINMIYKNRSK